MPRFADMSVAQFLEAIASPDPTPGGGTAAAIAGAIGTALLAMVAGLAKTRTQAGGEGEALAVARAALTEIRARLVTLADVDTDAFNQVMSAYRSAGGAVSNRPRSAACTGLPPGPAVSAA